MSLFLSKKNLTITVIVSLTSMLPVGSEQHTPGKLPVTNEKGEFFIAEKNAEQIVMPGRLMFRNKKPDEYSGIEFYRGNLSLVQPEWQNLSAIQNRLITSMQFTVLDSGAASKLVFSQKQQVFCYYETYSILSEYHVYLDMCFKADAKKNAADFVKKIRNKLVVAFQQNKAPRLFFRYARLEKNQIKDVDKEKLIYNPYLPRGFLPVGLNQGRIFSIDSTGLAETEIFFEKLTPVKATPAAIDVYEQSIKIVLKKQNNWSFIDSTQFSQDKSETKKEERPVHCMLFTQNNKSKTGKAATAKTNYCHRVVNIPEKGLYRMVMLVVFPEIYFDQKNLAQKQLKYLASQPDDK